MTASFTFKDSGIEVQIRRVSPLLALELQKKFPAPRPPRNKVTDMDGKETWEENYADPDYALTLNKYNADLEERMRRLVIMRGVVHTLTEEQKAQVDELRTFWKETYDEDLKGSDLEVFISYIAIGSDGDLGDLINTIMKRSQPTEGETKEVLNSFPDSVQG